MRRSRALFAALIAAVALSIAPLGPSVAEDPYEINVILALTGPGTFLGTSQKASLDVLQEVVNKQGGIKGRPIKFVYYDDQTNPQLAVQLTNTIMAKKVPIILGSDLSATCRAMDPLFKNGPVEYCLSPAIYPPKGGYVFTSSVSTKDLITATIRYFHQRGWKRFARITTTDASGQDADVNVPETLALPEFKDMTVTANEHYNQTDQSVAAQMARIKATNPQALLIWAPGTPFGTALRAMKDAGLDIPTATTSANMVISQLKQYTGLIPKDGLYFQGYAHMAGLAENPQMKRAIDTFTAALKDHGLDNDVQHGMAWDPAMITVNAFRALGTNASAEQIRDWIGGQKSYAGITGIYDFKDLDPHGLAARDALIFRWDPDKTAFVVVSKFGGYL
ncbi:MAG TPA: ABC transporter substrate-binding protein [Candidatus Binatia bacterium]|nr:ABC transporter substrate-binding protein [Candidatus Binatia bacterium]